MTLLITSTAAILLHCQLGHLRLGGKTRLGALGVSGPSSDSGACPKPPIDNFWPGLRLLWGKQRALLFRIHGFASNNVKESSLDTWQQHFTPARSEG